MSELIRYETLYFSQGIGLRLRFGGGGGLDISAYWALTKLYTSSALNTGQETDLTKPSLDNVFHFYKSSINKEI